MSHLDEGQLHELLDGELDESARAAALAHLASCERCRAAYDEAKSFLAEADALIDAVQLPAIGKVEGETPKVESGASTSDFRLSTADTERRRRISTYRTLAWAASLVLAVGLGWYGSTMSRSAPQAAESAFGNAAASDAAAPVASGPPADAPTPAAAAAPKSALASADKAVRQQAPSAPPSVEEKAGADEVLAAAANQAPQPAPEPVTTSSDAGALAGLTRTAPAQAPAPLAAYAPREAEGRRKERDAAPAAQGAGLDSSTQTYAAKRARAFDRVDMEEAVRILGGSIRLIDGLTPIRIFRDGGADRDGTSHVRVVYEDPPGRELWLDQRRVISMADMRAEAATALLPGDTTEVALDGGARSLHWVDQNGFLLVLTGFLPADSLRQLLRRVQ